MSYSELIYKGYLIKCGISPNEAEAIKNAAPRSPSGTYMERMGYWINISGRKNAKTNASIELIQTALMTDHKDPVLHLSLVKGYFAVHAYLCGNEFDMSTHIDELLSFYEIYLNDDSVNIPEILNDESKLVEIKHQAIASAALGSRKGFLSKVLG